MWVDVEKKFFLPTIMITVKETSCSDRFGDTYERRVTETNIMLEVRSIK